MTNSINPNEAVNNPIDAAIHFDQIQNRIRTIENQLSQYESTLSSVQVNKLTQSAVSISAQVNGAISQYADMIKQGADSWVDKDRVIKLLNYIESRNGKTGSLAISLGNDLLDYAHHAETLLSNLDYLKASNSTQNRPEKVSELKTLVTQLHTLFTDLETNYPGLPVVNRLDKLMVTIEPLLDQLPTEIESELLAHLPVSLDSLNSYLEKTAQAVDKKLEGQSTQDYLRDAAKVVGYLDKGCDYLQKNWSKKVKLSAIINVGGSIGINAGWGAAVAAKLGDKLGATEALHQEVWAIDILAPITVTLGTFLKLSKIGLESAADWIDVDQMA